jgi:hypothetical protein
VFCPARGFFDVGEFCVDSLPEGTVLVVRPAGRRRAASKRLDAQEASWLGAFGHRALRGRSPSTSIGNRCWISAHDMRARSHYC